MSLCNYQVRGSIAVIEMDSPPVNGLGIALRRLLVENIDRAQSDKNVRAIVVSGNKRGFSAGADMNEFTYGGAAVEPTVPSLIKMLDACEMPVVAAISGDCLGGGLELALACHYRVCTQEAKVGLPEVSLGLLPAAGGTQRLPRIIGVEAALNMILSGAIMRAEKLQDTDLFDQIVEDDVLVHAVKFAEEVLLQNKSRRRIRDKKVEFPHHEAFFQFARTSVKTSSKTPLASSRCVDAVAASVTKAFDQGIEFEKESFAALMSSTESKALRHAFFSQRMASKLDDVSDDTEIRPIESVAVIGAGTMGAGIAMSFSNVSIPVTILEANAQALDRGLASIRKNYESSQKKGKLSADQAAERIGLIKGTTDYADIRNADVVIEAVFEDMAAKEQVFRRLDETMKPGAILATNTSTLDVNQIASFTKRPEDVVGLHFFSPANIMKLLEVVRGEKTAKDVMASVLAMAKRIKKVSVVSGVCFGFIGNRMIERYHQQAIAMLEEGALPQQIDLALERWGMAMGPFRMSDMAGNDVSWLVRKYRFSEDPEQASLYALPDQLCELGRFGQKAAKGWYRYEAGSRVALPDPEVDALIVGRSQQLGVPRRTIGDEEIIQRCVLAMTNEGSKIVQEGIAQRASDIDVVYLTGYGFPKHRGGPMFWADTMGLYNVANLIQKFAAIPNRLANQAWHPAPLLLELAAKGGNFS